MNFNERNHLMNLNELIHLPTAWYRSFFSDGFTGTAPPFAVPAG